MPVPTSEPRRPSPGVRRAALLDALRDLGRPTTVAELAPVVGLHPNTVRAHLEVLVREGSASRATEVRSTRGRPRELYAATSGPAPERSYALLAELLAAQLSQVPGDPTEHAVAAGRRWADVQATWDHADGSGSTRPADPREPVLEVLRRSGFAPEVAADGSRILLRHCPFLQVAQAHQDVVCGAHLGLIQRTAERVAPGLSVALHPFAEPGACVTVLGPSAVDGQGETGRERSGRRPVARQ